MPRCFSISIQSEVAWRAALRAFTLPAIWIAPAKRSSFSVSVVLPASGCEMIAKVRRRAASAANGVRLVFESVPIDSERRDVRPLVAHRGVARELAHHRPERVGRAGRSRYPVDAVDAGEDDPALAHRDETPAVRDRREVRGGE